MSNVTLDNTFDDYGINSEAERAYGHSLFNSLSNQSQDTCNLVAKRVLLERGIKESEKKPENQRNYHDLNRDVLNKVLSDEIWRDQMKYIWKNPISKHSPYYNTPFETLYRQEKPVETIDISNGAHLGGGVYGSVDKVEEINGQKLTPYLKMVAKTATSAQDASQELKDELAFLVNLHDHRGLSAQDRLKIFPKPVIGTFKGEITGVSPEFEGNNLHKYLSHNQLSLSEKMDIATQLIEQSDIFFHKAKVLYTDIKIENILVDTTTSPPRVLYSDFGNSHFTDNPQTIPPYGLTYSRSSSLRIDIESIRYGLTDTSILEKAMNSHASRAIGLILYQLFTGDLDVTAEDVESKLQEADFLQPLKNSHPQQAYIIEKMLGKNLSYPCTPHEAWEAWKKFI